MIFVYPNFCRFLILLFPIALLGRYEAATESLLRSTVLNPGHANAHMLTAHAAMYAGTTFVIGLTDIMQFL